MRQALLPSAKPQYAGYVAWRGLVEESELSDAVLHQLWLAARQVLAPQFAELVEKTQGLFFQPIFDLESERIAFGRIALLGDAAFWRVLTAGWESGRLHAVPGADGEGAGNGGALPDAGSRHE